MTKYSIFIGLLLIGVTVFGQAEMGKSSLEGQWYVYWGWNRGWYTNSDIRFEGEDYDFTLNKVVAKDRQSHFDVKTYLSPTYITIPQYNFRIGYCLNDYWDISFGVDHMKYVVQQYQTVGINGVIGHTDTQYDGMYSNDQIKLTDDFLQFEHTDGLNYGNLEARHTSTFLEREKIDISVIKGAGVGVLYPKTNTVLVGKARYDEFHLAGFGLAGVVGVNATFWDWLFIQSELKGGYISMPDIRTTLSPTDKASQDFMFLQWNVVFGGRFRLWRG